MWLGIFEPAASLVFASWVMFSPSFSLSYRAPPRGLMARDPKPEQPGRSERSEPGKLKIGGRPLGGADFLLSRTGDGFSVPIARPRVVDGLKRLRTKETLTEDAKQRSAGCTKRLQKKYCSSRIALTKWQTSASYNEACCGSFRAKASARRS